MSIETEIKFTVPDKTVLARIASLGSVAGYIATDTGTRTHTDTYFDTVDFTLYHEKIVFRLREYEDRSVLTCKAQGVSEGSILRRIEIEEVTLLTPEDLSGGEMPDSRPVRELYERIGIVNLTRSLGVTNNRRTIFLKKDGRAYFELVLDDVDFCGPRGRTVVLELEVESVDSDEGNLLEVGTWLKSRFELGDAGPSKYILGMDSVGGMP
ncbi:CYTH domain-containing protein [Candidatus Latescibacterota bacterium]